MLKNSKLLLVLLFFFILNPVVNSQPFPHSDAQKVRHLMLFVSFSDQLNTPWSRSLSGFKELMNSDDPSSYSMRSFVTTTSYGKMDFKAVFVEHSNPTDTVPDYQDKYPSSYYKLQNSSGSIPFAAANEGELNRRRDSLLTRLVSFTNNRLPDNTDIDGNMDGAIDNLIVTCRVLDYGDSFIFSNYASYGLPWRNTMGSAPKIKNYNVRRFASVSAISYNNPHVGEIYVHELGHVFGVPDVYTTGPFQYYRGLRGPFYSDWYFKRSYTSYYMWANLGWIPKDNAPLITKSGTYSLNSLYSDSPDGVTYRIQSLHSETEFFMLEFRTRHPHEWWHNSEGLLISLINPGTRGNARWDNTYGPMEAYIVSPKSGIRDALLLNRSVSSNTDPALKTSNGMPAGFSINNIRKIDNKLYFDVEFDVEPIISAYEKPDIVNGNSAGTVTWDITVNNPNKKSWNAVSNVPWLTVTPDYENSQLLLSYERNFGQIQQRNAVITLTAPGAANNYAYFVQRGNANQPALWLPKLINDTIEIKGAEDSYNMRIIGDISASSDDWMRNLNSKQIQKGRVFDLDTRLRAFYSFTNKTNKPIITDIFYNDLRNNNLKFTIKQMPLEGDTLVYKPLKQSLPVINDGKWYLIRTERARDYKASFLGAKYHDSANLLVGLQPLSKLSDSLLWTVESIGENVILRNKALGYLDMTLYDRFLKFQLTKPTTGFKMIENQGRNGHNVLGAAFQGTTSSVKGLHMSVTDFVFGDYFSLTDNSTFFFEEFDIDYIISYGSEYLISVNIGTEIGNTSDVAYNRLLDALSNANYKARGLSMAGQRPYLVEITNAIEQVKNDIVMPLTSTEENPVWYRINRYETDFWKFLDEDIKQYLNVTEIGQPLQKSNLDVNSGKFLFRFEITDNGMLKIIPKSFRNYMLSSASSTITITKESSVNTNFDIVPIMTRYGVNFAIRGREIYNGYYFITFKGGEENIVRSLGMSSAGLPNNSKILSDGYLFNFEYEENQLTNTSNILIDNTGTFEIRYRVIDRKIILDDPKNSRYSLYNAYGVKKDLNDTLSNGVYIIRRSDGLTEKILVDI